MAKPASDHIMSVEHNDQPDEEELTEVERQRLHMALSNPVGETARRLMADDTFQGEIVVLKGSRREKHYSHRVDLGGDLEPVYFYDGRAKATPEQKAKLQEHRYI